MNMPSFPRTHTLKSSDPSLMLLWGHASTSAMPCAHWHHTPITLAMSTLMGLSTLCVISQVVPSGESSTPEGAEASSVTPMQIGPATKPIVDQYQGMRSSTQEELCHGCQSSRVQSQRHQPML